MKYDITIRIDVTDEQSPEDVADNLLRYGNGGLDGWGGKVVAIAPVEDEDRAVAG
jgi:hypothetical protein